MMTDADFINNGIEDQSDLLDLRSLKQEVTQLKERLHPVNLDDLLVTLKLKVTKKITKNTF